MSSMAKESNLKSVSGLRSQCLSFTEVIAQSIANIAPSVGPALGIPLVFATAGNGTWLTYIFATIAVALVGYHINQFARRSASPGALYTYVADGLGAGAGFVSGWGLVLAYVLTGCATLAGLANYTNVLIGYVGLSVPPIIICILGIVSVWFMVYKDIQMSAKLMLALEGISLLLIFALGAVVLVRRGTNIDFAQFTLSEVSFDSLRIGLVLAFFSFVGFESATALGEEAKNPLRNIPKAVISSAIFVGMIFVVFSYTEVAGFIGTGSKLSEVDAPLAFLADRNGVGILGLLITIGAMISFWSCTVACTTASGRILMTMGRHNILPASLAQTHEKNETPHNATTVVSIVTFAIPAVLVLTGAGLLDIFGYLGTIATLGFLLSYAMIVISVPVFLHRRKELKAKNIIISAASMIILLIPIIGSVYPLPAYPYSLFPFIFLGWIAAGGIWFKIAKARNKDLVRNMEKDIASYSENAA